MRSTLRGSAPGIRGSWPSFSCTDHRGRWEKEERRKEARWTQKLSTGNWSSSMVSFSGLYLFDSKWPEETWLPADRAPPRPFWLWIPRNWELFFLLCNSLLLHSGLWFSLSKPCPTWPESLILAGEIWGRMPLCLIMVCNWGLSQPVTENTQECVGGRERWVANVKHKFHSDT